MNGLSGWIGLAVGIGIGWLLATGHIVLAALIFVGYVVGRWVLAVTRN